MSRIDNESVVERVEPRRMPVFFITDNNPLRGFPHVGFDCWFVTRAQAETQKLIELQRELADH